MHRQDQRMFFFRHLYQPPTDQRSGFQIERDSGFFQEQTMQFRVRVLFQAQIIFQEREAGIGRPDELYRAAIELGEGCAQGFVAGDDAIESVAQRHPVEIAAQAEPPANVVNIAYCFKLRQKPESLLCE
jgi:hypothetical protein